jgi:hypothetical protein
VKKGDDEERNGVCLEIPICDIGRRKGVYKHVASEGLMIGWRLLFGWFCKHRDNVNVRGSGVGTILEWGLFCVCSQLHSQPYTTW